MRYTLLLTALITTTTGCGLPPTSPLGTTNSDPAAAHFRAEWLPRLLRDAIDLGKPNTPPDTIPFDPTHLILPEDTRIRVYFIGESTGNPNALCLTLHGQPSPTTTLFPEVASSMPTATTYERITQGANDIGERGRLTPLVPGDFTDLPLLPADAQLEFFLIHKQARIPWPRTSTLPDRNLGKGPRATALAYTTGPYILLGFEDGWAPNGHDPNDVIIALELPNTTHATLTAPGAKPRLAEKAQTHRNARTWGLATRAATTTTATLLTTTLLLLLLRTLLRRNARDTYNTAARLIDEGDIQTALPLITTGKRHETEPMAREKWDALEMSVYLATNDIAALTQLYKTSPRPYTTDEKAALLVARTLLETGCHEQLAELRKRWLAREGHTAPWLGIETDLLIQQNQHQDAILLLQRFQFQGQDEATRLARLGYLTTETDPQTGWNHLNQAAKIGPNHPDTWLFHAQAHEQAGRHNEAQNALQKAYATAPNDHFTRDKIATFLTRQANYTQAIQLWTQAMAPPSLDFIWLKALFWRRMILDQEPFKTNLQCPPGPLHPAVQLLLQLPQNQFWDHEKYQQAHKKITQIHHTPETHWLQLLEALRTNHEDQALELLNLGLPTGHETLQTALHQILTYRKTGFFLPNATCIKPNTPPPPQPPPNTQPTPPPPPPPPQKTHTKHTPPPPHHPLFHRLDQWTTGKLPEDPPDLTELIETNMAYPAALNAAGWKTAAAILATAPE